MRPVTFLCLSIELDRCLRFRGFLTNAILPFVSGSPALFFFLHCLHLFLFICLSILLAVTWDDLARKSRRGEKGNVTVQNHWQKHHFARLALLSIGCSLISYTWMWYSMPLLTCVTVRLILRPLSWSPRLASRPSSSPDSCSSSGCSSTTASWFTLMSGIKDCGTATGDDGGEKQNRGREILENFWLNLSADTRQDKMNTGFVFPKQFCKGLTL